MKMEEFNPRQSKFEVFGEEMLEKVVKKSGNSGRVYLPPHWIGCRVKIIRMDPITRKRGSEE
jgi:putative transposon-encoded protein